MYIFFFFQAEDGIRDVAVTGVQTCALPISARSRATRCCAERRSCRGPPTGRPSLFSTRCAAPISGKELEVCLVERHRTPTADRERLERRQRQEIREVQRRDLHEHVVAKAEFGVPKIVLSPSH